MQKWTLLLLLSLMSLAACVSLPVVDVASVNHNGRVNYLVLHFTSEDFAESLRLLTERTDNPVSAHYLVPEPEDPTYSAGKIRIHRLVAEQRRAWHAGRSYWAGKEALNDSSIGIEIVNQSACVDSDPDAPVPENQTCTFHPYADAQINLVAQLIADILERHPDIDPVDIVGHADIATDRRVDPGPLFPWRRLYDQGIGAWFDEATVADFLATFRAEKPSTIEVQAALEKYGYKIELTGEEDAQTRFVVRAFQMHFRPAGVSGRIDVETAAILYGLNLKYRTDNALQ